MIPSMGQTRSQRKVFGSFGETMTRGGSGTTAIADLGMSDRCARLISEAEAAYRAGNIALGMALTAEAGQCMDRTRVSAGNAPGGMMTRPGGANLFPDDGSGTSEIESGYTKPRSAQASLQTGQNAGYVVGAIVVAAALGGLLWFGTGRHRAKRTSA